MHLSMQCASCFRTSSHSTVGRALVGVLLAVAGPDVAALAARSRRG